MSPQQSRVLAIGAHISLAGLLYGLDTGFIVPVTSMPQFISTIGSLTPTQQGIYVSSILLSASFSSLASGYISDRISRKWGIFTGGFITFIGTVISASSSRFSTLIVARLITGIGAGQAIAVSTVYLIEIAPLETRGVMACMLQLYVVMGITSGYFICYGSQRLRGSIAWRLPFVVQAGFAAMHCVGMVFVPFSPRWLVQAGKSADARQVLEKVRKEGDVRDELRQIEDSLMVELRESTSSFKDIFGRKHIRRTLLGVLLMSFQQMTGIDAVLYYAPILFQQAGFATQRATFLASGVTGLVMIICTIPAQIWIDHWGRRKPLIIGGFAMTLCLLTIGSLYAKYGVLEHGGVKLRSETARWVVVVLIYLFTANFSWSWAVVGKIYACEIIPTRLRANVCAVEQLANWMVNFTITLTAPLFLRSSPSGPYFLYGFATLCAVGMCLFIPETKGRSLEEIEALFEKGPRGGGGGHESSTP